MNRNEFLTRLYQYCEDGQVETRALPGKKQAFHNRGAWDSIDKWCQKHSKSNLYMAVATRNGGGTKEHIAEIPAIWTDIDFKDTPKEEARKALWEFEVQPSLIVDSGGGYHAYWILHEPATKDDIPLLEDLLRRITAYFNGDPQATDASRILRLPDTLNYKYDPPRPVKLVWVRDFLYSMEDLGELPPLTNLLFNNKLERVGVRGDSEGENTEIERHRTAQGGTERHSTYPINFEVGHHDSTLFSITWHLVKAGMPENDVLEVIQYTAKNMDPGKETDRWAREKVRSAYKRLSSQERNLAEEIREFIRHSSGTFTAQEVDKTAQIGTKRERHNRKTILLRLLKEGVIERVPPRNNHFRRVETECEEIDFLNAPTDELPITLPLGLSDHFKAYRKNIITIAGDQDAGKTALLLNFIRNNMDQHEIHYFSSEMGSTELRIRLNEFNDISLKEWNFNAHERSSNFADVINPNAINVIDFLEMHDAFYTVGQHLTDIYDKLQEGIAIIALQKTKGVDLGRGGSFSLEKPRLYVSLSNDFPGHKIKIVKCKNWREKENPNGLYKKFKIIRGCQLLETSQWDRES